MINFDEKPVESSLMLIMSVLFVGLIGYGIYNHLEKNNVFVTNTAGENRPVTIERTEDIKQKEGNSHTIDFWTAHGILFCLACAFFPRITLAVLSLGMSVLSITALGVLGWVFVPRILIAGIGTYYYWDTNPFVCILAWIIALCGEGIEKKHCNRE